MIHLLGFAEGSEEAAWILELDALGQPEPFDPISVAVAEERLQLLGIRGLDAKDVLATLPVPGSPWWWCLEREAHRLITAIGDETAKRGAWPSFEGPAQSVERRCHFVHVALAVVPASLEWFRRRGISEETALASLSEVRRHMAIHRRVHGITGIDAAWWVTLCLRGELFELGRLQYNPFVLGVSEESPHWYDPAEAEARGPGFRRGDASLGIHIPEGGRLSAEAVEASLEKAAAFFARHFPARSRRVATCMSWLLDDQLAEYLPESSNIVSFQRRFEVVPGWLDGDGEVLQFVFRQPEDASLDELPQTSTLERAAVAHLRAGRHWRMRTGWLDLPAGRDESATSLAEKGRATE